VIQATLATIIMALAAALAIEPARAEDDFALGDGDTLVFLGDSITAARGYTKIVEHYTLMRYPGRHVRFINAGQGGDTASGSLQRLERDVFEKDATVVTVAFGVNDIGWGMKADAEHRQQYLDGIRAIIEQCQARGVRPYICSAAITAEDPEKAERGFLQKMTDDGLELARSLGAGTIDLQRGMREIQRRVVAGNENEKDVKKRTRLHVEDGVHLNELGQLAMAYAMLKGLGAPPDVSSAVLDARDGSVLGADHCRISEVITREDGIGFVRLDEGLPLNLGPLSGLQYRWIPIPDGINRYLVTVRNLPAGSYEISVDGRSIGKTSGRAPRRGTEHQFDDLRTGGNPGGPWDAQSTVVKDLVDARDKLWMSGVTRNRFLGSHPATAELGSAGSRRE
jgi:lysophospholipase L1-like esterase